MSPVMVWDTGPWRVLGEGGRGTHVEHLFLKDWEGSPLRMWVQSKRMLRPVARTTDPDTSHQAAAMQTPSKQHAGHLLVLAALYDHGPMTDFELAYRISAALGREVLATSAGKRRGELVTLGLVRNSGRKGKSKVGSPAVVWELTDAGRQEVAA